MPDKDKIKTPRGFWAAFRKAEKVVKDVSETARVLHDAEIKATSHASRIQNISSDLQTLFRMVHAWIKGDYKKVPVQIILFAVAGMLYFLNPFDVIPDYIPGVGFIDDIAVIGFVVRSIKKEIVEFLIWEKHS